MRNVIDESLAEHTLEVAYLTHALVSMHNIKDNSIDAGQAVIYALYHDCSEILTGDMPTPVKYYNNELKEAYKKVEQSATLRLINMLPENLVPQYKDYLSEPPQDIKKYVKAADRLSALIKCMEEKKMGNMDFEKAEQGIIESIKQMDVPEAIEFIEKYLPSYGLCFDEL